MRDELSLTDAPVEILSYNNEIVRNQNRVKRLRVFFALTTEICNNMNLSRKMRKKISIASM